ncbi:HSP20-like chaperone [Chytridium lagenaria]|nr:HSP20-like chaperone [Chytridium lagenaria]
MMGPSMVGWPADYDVYSQQQQQPQQQQITGEQGTQQTEQQQQQPQQQTSQQLQQQQQPSQQQLSAPSTTTRQQLAPFMRGIPRLDITETPTSYIIHADLPGVKKEEININVKDDLLTISGERRASSDVKDSNRRIVERGYGRFSRSVRLPSDADAENVAAKMEGGVLELSLGKAEKTVEEGIRKIDIQ